uniref:Uncharacterized protein n=1 Tax=Parascaris univalens TaxID=6257 RepID=A0A915A0F6_PARUN
ALATRLLRGAITSKNSFKVTTVSMTTTWLSKWYTYHWEVPLSCSLSHY